MTPTQKGRRSDALYMDTRATHRRQLCDMVVNREADIEDLKEEMYGLRCDIGRLENENAKLREQMERLVTLLRNDCDIDASWDGLRGFWSIGLTDDGCLMRDRACKAEAENAKLQELVRSAVRCITDVPNCDSCAIGEQVSGVWVCHLIGAAKELGVEMNG